MNGGRGYTGQDRQPTKGVLSGQLLLWATGQIRLPLVMPPWGQEADIYLPTSIGGWLGCSWTLLASPSLYLDREKPGES